MIFQPVFSYNIVCEWNGNAMSENALFIWESKGFTLSRRNTIFYKNTSFFIPIHIIGHLKLD